MCFFFFWSQNRKYFRNAGKSEIKEKKRGERKKRKGNKYLTSTCVYWTWWRMWFKISLFVARPLLHYSSSSRYLPYLPILAYVRIKHQSIEWEFGLLFHEQNWTFFFSTKFYYWTWRVQVFFIHEFSFSQKFQKWILWYQTVWNPKTQVWRWSDSTAIWVDLLDWVIDGSALCQ